MKELSIEEKAKRYDKAIEIINDYYQEIKFSSTRDFTQEEKILEKAFPELKENEDEDERVRNVLVDYFKGYKELEGCGVKTFNGIPTDNIIAWFEKQGKNNMGISEATKQKLEDSLNKALEKETPESCNEFLDKQGTDISSFPKEQQMFMQKYLSLDKITLIKLLAERDANNAEIIESFEEQGEQKPAEEYNITGIGSRNAQGKLGEMIKKLKPVNEVLEQNPATEVGNYDHKKVLQTIINEQNPACNEERR